MMAPDGRCKALDASADGYVRAEAAVVIMLQSASAWSSAASTGSAHMVALLLAGTAVNQDGRSSSLTAPHGPSQQAVMLAAMGAAAVAPPELHGVEMHGTGG
jgi:acyl transferase domain-containing protein